MTSTEQSSPPEPPFVVEAAPGQDLFRAGEPAGAAFVVKEGQVEILGYGLGITHRVALVGPGGVFGEEALFDAAPRRFTARAVTASRCIKLDRESLDPLLGAHPEVAKRLLTWLSAQLAEMREARLVAAIAPTLTLGPTRSSTQPVVTARRGSHPRLLHVESGIEFPLSENREYFVGRADPAAGFVPPIDLTAVDTSRSMSRKHARIVRSGTEFSIYEESGARNGTTVNGKKLAPGVPARLVDGDEICFGVVRIRVDLGGAQKA